MQQCERLKKGRMLSEKDEKVFTRLVIPFVS